LKHWPFAVAALAVAAAAVKLYLLVTAPSPPPAAPPPSPPPEVGSRQPAVGTQQPDVGSRQPDAGTRQADAGPRLVPSSSPQTRATARADREALVERVRSSGSGKEPWDDQARVLLGSLAGTDVEVTWGGCYIAGCTATIVFSSRDAYDHAVDDVARGSAFHAWTGGKKWSAPEVGDDGRWTAALVLYRPD